LIFLGLIFWDKNPTPCLVDLIDEFFKGKGFEIVFIHFLEDFFDYFGENGIRAIELMANLIYFLEVMIE
jgi:hypothetical protein